MSPADQSAKPPDNIVVERSSEGEPESQCFRQVGLAQIVPGRDEDGGEVLELGVAKDLSTSTAQKTLSISKAQFNAVFNTIDNAGLIENLPVYPIRHASTRELHHLFLRGWKMWLLSWGTHVVENTGDPEHVSPDGLPCEYSSARYPNLRCCGVDIAGVQ